jgi:hypothetical protein
MALMRFALAAVGLALVAPQDPAVPNVVIDHQAVDCVLAGQPPALTACFTPPEEIVRARVYYRLGEAAWQFVPLVPEGSCFGAVLPRPTRTDGTLRYYLEAVDLASQSTRSSEHRAIVVQDQNACAGVLAAVRPGATQVASAGKKKTLPFILIGAGAAGAGVALAGGGGGGGGVSTTQMSSLPATVTTTIVTNSTTPESSTTTTPGSSTTTPGSTTTTVPGSTTTTIPGPTTTTLPGSTTTTTATTLPGSTTTTTTTTTTTPTTSSTTTTTMPCAFTITPGSANFPAVGGEGQFTLGTSASSCAWTLDSSQAWLTPQVASGTGGRIVSYSVAGPNLLFARTGIISVSQQGSANIVVQQAGVTGVAEAHRPQLTSQLAVAGAAGQIVWNGASVAYAAEGTTSAAAPLGPGSNRVEAQLVSADGKPGTWRFSFTGGIKGLRPLAGKVDAVGPDSISFRLSGRAGERVVFVFEAEP